VPVSTEDYVTISDFLARYCWLVDESDGDGWSALWTEDGVFTGVSPEPIIGREALRAVPLVMMKHNGAEMRHMVGNLACDYVDGRDTVLARYYNFVTDWPKGGRMNCMALCDVTLVRNGDTWLVRRNDTRLLAG